MPSEQHLPMSDEERERRQADGLAYLLDVIFGRPEDEDEPGDARETVDDPGWYTSGAVETIDKIEAVIDGLPAREAFLLGQVIRYVDRAGEKDDPAIDLGKANNYAHRLVFKHWRLHGLRRRAAEHIGAAVDSFSAALGRARDRALRALLGD